MKLVHTYKKTSYTVCYRPQSKGDNTFGSVRPSICPFVCVRSNFWIIWPTTLNFAWGSLQVVGVDVRGSTPHVRCITYKVPLHTTDTSIAVAYNCEGTTQIMQDAKKATVIDSFIPTGQIPAVLCKSHKDSVLDCKNPLHLREPWYHADQLSAKPFIHISLTMSLLWQYINNVPPFLLKTNALSHKARQELLSQDLGDQRTTHV